MSISFSTIKDLYIALRGFHTNRKLIIIESDDWGSIRMPSKTIFDKLELLGDNPSFDAFLSNDSLESENDLCELYKVLMSVRDSKGNYPVITANFAVANPNFDKINYKNDSYVFEPFYETYNKYYNQNKVLELVKKGIALKVFFPQLHCREHMNVNRWMKDLRDGNKNTILALNNKMIGVGKSFSFDNKFGYMDAFNSHFTTQDEFNKILEDANNIFKDTFGYKSRTFVASCFVWNNDLEKILFSKGVIGIQSGPWQNITIKKNGKKILKRKIHYTGEKNKFNQIYTVRNCAYEPAYYQNPDDCALICIEQIKKSFKQRKPAIINSHRFNYIGTINNENSKKNLIGLKKVLDTIVSLYNDVEFITTSELIDIILEGKKNA